MSKRTEAQIERLMVALHHRDNDNWTYKQIGQALGVNAERARRLVLLARLHLKDIETNYTGNSYG